MRLDRGKSSASLPAETWSKLALGLTTPDRMDVIDHPVLEKLDEFISDYRAANPR